MQRGQLLNSLIAAVYTFISVSAFAAPGVVVDVALTPAGDFKLKTDEVTGEAIQEGANVRAENIRVKLGNLKTGLPLRDKHAKDKYLEVQKFPEATLMKATGTGGKGKGRLKIRDIEKDVEGTYKVEGAELIAAFPIKLSEFGIKGVKYMGIGVDDTANIQVTVPIKKK